MAGIIESSENPEEEALNLQRIGNKLDLLEQVVDDYFLFEEDVDTEQMEAGIYRECWQVWRIPTLLTIQQKNTGP